MTSKEFLADLKARALELARVGSLAEAVAMVVREINGKPEMKMKIHHAAVTAGQLKAMEGDSRGVIAWIESIQ